MINGTSKILKASRLLIIRAIVMMGLSIGNIILKKICLSEAPITLAARIGSDGNAVMPAYISRNMNGVHCQASARMTADKALHGTCNQSTATTVPETLLSTSLMAPWVEKIVWNVKPEIAGITIIGTRKIEAKTALPRKSQEKKARARTKPTAHSKL